MSGFVGGTSNERGGERGAAVIHFLNANPNTLSSVSFHENEWNLIPNDIDSNQACNKERESSSLSSPRAIAIQYES